jgi:hypothetical protein
MKQFGTKDLEPIETCNVRKDFPVCSYSIIDGSKISYRIEITDFCEVLTEVEAKTLLKELEFHIQRIRRAKNTIHPSDLNI